MRWHCSLQASLVWWRSLAYRAGAGTGCRDVCALVFALDADTAGQQQWQALARQAPCEASGVELPCCDVESAPDGGRRVARPAAASAPCVQTPPRLHGRWCAVKPTFPGMQRLDKPTCHREGTCSR